MCNVYMQATLLLPTCDYLRLFSKECVKHLQKFLRWLIESNLCGTFWCKKCYGKLFKPYHTPNFVRFFLEHPVYICFSCNRHTEEFTTYSEKNNSSSLRGAANYKPERRDSNWFQSLMTYRRQSIERVCLMLLRVNGPIIELLSGLHVHCLTHPFLRIYQRLDNAKVKLESLYISLNGRASRAYSKWNNYTPTGFQRQATVLTVQVRVFKLKGQVCRCALGLSLWLSL